MLYYVNDVVIIYNVNACNLYADDTLLCCRGSTLHESRNNLRKCMSDIQQWYDKNRVVINASKPNAMLVTTRNKIAQLNEWDLDVFLCDDILIQIDCADYLGIKLDQHISWNNQVNNLNARKLVFKISRLHRLKPILPTHIMVKIYNGIIILLTPSRMYRYRCHD